MGHRNLALMSIPQARNFSHVVYKIFATSQLMCYDITVTQGNSMLLRRRILDCDVQVRRWQIR